MKRSLTEAPHQEKSKQQNIAKAMTFQEVMSSPSASSSSEIEILKAVKAVPPPAHKRKKSEKVKIEKQEKHEPKVKREPDIKEEREVKEEHVKREIATPSKLPYKRKLSPEAYLGQTPIKRKDRLRLYQMATPQIPSKRRRLTEGEKALDELRIAVQKKRAAEKRAAESGQSTITHHFPSTAAASGSTPPNVTAAANGEPESLARDECEKGVACLSMRELQYYTLMQHGLNNPSLMLQTYNLRTVPQTFHIILSSKHGSSSQYIGRCKVDECSEITACLQLKQKPISFQSDVEKHYWHDRIKDGKAVFAWRVRVTHQIPVKPVRLTFQKHRHRHFFCTKDVLEAGVPRPPQRASLYETAPFFLRLLSTRDYRLLQLTAQALDGHKLRIGTTCSGSDIIVTAIKATIRQLNREFNVAHLPIHTFSNLTPHNNCQSYVLSVGVCKVWLIYPSQTEVRFQLACGMCSHAR